MTVIFLMYIICHTDHNCTWLTYHPDTSFCELLTNCSSLETQLCNNCLSAQHDCITNEKVCSIKGNCRGIRIHSKEMPTAKDCLQLCHSTRGCRWFTFYTLVPVCALFKNCPSIDESCKDCISGERRCIDENVSNSTEMTHLETSRNTTITTTSNTTTTSSTAEMTLRTSEKRDGKCQQFEITLFYVINSKVFSYCLP